MNADPRIAPLMAYLAIVLRHRFAADQIGERNVRELATLGLAVDALLRGGVARRSGFLAQRWGSLEGAITDGHWAFA